MDLSLGMKYTNMIIVAILALHFLIKLHFPANTPISREFHRRLLLSKRESSPYLCDNAYGILLGGGGNFNRQVTGVCHLTSEIAP